MPRKISEWIGRTDDAMPGRTVRDRLLRDQNDCCAACGLPFGVQRRAHCDHIIALIDGGYNRESNLQMLCEDCHKTKTSAEASSRAEARNHRANDLLAREPSQIQSRGFRPARPQRRASSPILKFSPIDGVWSDESAPRRHTAERD